jgi:hypothetical protein
MRNYSLHTTTDLVISYLFLGDLFLFLFKIGFVAHDPKSQPLEAQLKAPVQDKPRRPILSTMIASAMDSTGKNARSR